LATSALCALAAGEMVTDVIVGRNNKGPYALSWTNIDSSSVVVICNGLMLKRGEKYNIDGGLIEAFQGLCQAFHAY
jgi:hypothetical protein